MYAVVVYLPTGQPSTVRKEVENQIRRAAKLDGWLRLNPPLVKWNPPQQPWVFPASDLNMDHHGIQDLSRVIEDMSGEKVQFGGRGGITDAGWFPLNGTPAVVYGPGDVHWAHRIDERVRLEDVVLYAKIISIFLMRWCGVE